VGTQQGFYARPQDPRWSFFSSQYFHRFGNVHHKFNPADGDDITETDFKILADNRSLWKSTS